LSRYTHWAILEGQVFGGRRRITSGIILLDWDGTVRPGFTILDWVRFLATRHVVAQRLVENIEGLLDAWSRGEIDYDTLAVSSAESYALGLKGLRVSSIVKQAESFHQEDRMRIWSAMGSILRYFKAGCLETIVISGAPAHILSLYQREYGFSSIYALQIGECGGRLDGVVESNPGCYSGKEDAVRQILALPTSRVIAAFGNSKGDQPMFAASKISVVVGAPTLLGSRWTYHLNPEEGMPGSERITGRILTVIEEEAAQ